MAWTNSILFLLKPIRCTREMETRFRSRFRNRPDLPVLRQKFQFRIYRFRWNPVFALLLCFYLFRTFLPFFFLSDSALLSLQALFPFSFCRDRASWFWIP